MSITQLGGLTGERGSAARISLDAMNADPNAELPIDGDPADAGRGTTHPTGGTSVRSERPAHLRLDYLALVASGGAVGTALREAISLAVSPVGSFPVAIFGINVLGAFALGVLLQALALRGDDVGRRRHVRLLVGTGVLGGFTTYSALSADSAELLSDGGLAIALVYGLATVIIGGLASWAGIALGARFAAPASADGTHPHPASPLPIDPDSTTPTPTPPTPTPPTPATPDPATPDPPTPDPTTTTTTTTDLTTTDLTTPDPTTPGPTAPGDAGAGR